MLYNWPNWWQPVAKCLLRPLQTLWPDSVRRHGKTCTKKPVWRRLILLVLALQSTTAFALGLGNIRVLSQPGEPLLAQIPLLSNNPDELDGATAALASADTFKRVGLPVPRGQVRDLQFAFTRDKNERAVIQVSTTTPIQVPSLSFLIEVNWAQGRIVREYSTLVSTPETLTALNEPLIELPEGVQSNLIVREMEPTHDPLAMPLVDDVWPEVTQETDAEAESAFTVVPSAPPARPARSSASSSTSVGAFDGKQVTVQRGQTLGQIAGAISRKNGRSLDQTMIAMLRANPQAFINGNLNLLREGAVLRVPDQEELNQVNATQARTMVREHMSQWQQNRGPVLQPAVASVTENPTVTTVSLESLTPPPSTSDARLEIAPAVSANQPNAQSTTGLEAGGTGNRLSASALLQEELASREAELKELHERVSELEALQKKQQALIELKDADLAAAQQRLAEAAQNSSSSEEGWGIWLVGSLLLLALAAAGAWLLHRRRAQSRLAFEDEDLAEVFEELKTEAEAAQSILKNQPATEETQASAASASTLKPTKQTMNDAAVVKPERSWPVEDSIDEILPEPIADHRERLELAIAYLDLGDTRTARNLLNEVVQGAEPKLRREALELLERLNWVN